MKTFRFQKLHLIWIPVQSENEFRLIALGTDRCCCVWCTTPSEQCKTNKSTPDSRCNVVLCLSDSVVTISVKKALCDLAQHDLHVHVRLS